MVRRRVPAEAFGPTRRWASSAIALTVSVLVTLGAVAPAMGAYSSTTESSHQAIVTEAYELSGWVASPHHPNWYWAHSDAWDSTDVYAACADLSGTARSRCQQVQRARLWAFRIDPVTHAVLEARPFSVSDPAWATDPFVAQNNDWEDIALGPPRPDGSGGTRVNLVVGALGDAAGNPVYDASGQDITCATRRLIELREPDLGDPSATTWTPWRIYDLRNIVGTAGLSSCNVETLVVADGADGDPTAFFVTKSLRKLFARSMDEATGRAPGTPPAPIDSDVAHRPAATYLGNVQGAKGIRFMAGTVNDDYVSLLSPRTPKHPCWILTWPRRAGGVGATLTQDEPTKHDVTCTGQTEGLTYTHDPQDPSVSTDDLLAVADNNSSSRSKFLYWFMPDR